MPVLALGVGFGAFLGLVMAVGLIFAPVAYVTSKVVNIPVIKQSVKIACKTPLLGNFMPDALCDVVEDGELMDAADKHGLSATIRAYFDCANRPPEDEEDGLCDPNALNKADSASAIPTERSWLIPVFVEAGRAHDVPWQLLAAVAGARTNFGEENCSPNGARGGFMNMTGKEWKRFGRDAGSTLTRPGDDNNCVELLSPQDPELGGEGIGGLFDFDKDGVKDPRDPVDAIYSYAAMLSSQGVRGREWKYNGDSANGCAVDEGRDGAIHPAPNANLPSDTQNVSNEPGGAIDAPDEYPGDDAPIEQRAAWMGKAAEKAGFPAELPVMASLVETGGALTNIQHGHADSIGFFQMRTSIWNKGEYAGFMSRPDLQMKWFVNQSKATKAGNTWKNTDLKPSNYGEFIADVERPAAIYRGRYQQQLNRAQELLQGSRTGPAPSGDRGTYAFPVDGNNSYSNDWGGARSDGRGGHKGTDVMAAKGTPLVAITDGQLYQVGSNSLGGKRLWLRSTAGEKHHYYYAHLNAFATKTKNGAKVKKGQVIGYVGNTGNASRGAPHLHLEIHPNGWKNDGGSAINPYPFLKAWETGTSGGGTTQVPTRTGAGQGGGGSDQSATTTAEGLRAWTKRQRANSPLLPVIPFIVAESEKAGVDPRIVIAISGLETEFGTTGNAAGLKNAWGLSGAGGPKQYARWEDSVSSLLRTLVNYRKDGLVTIAQIQQRYCPVGAANDPNNTNGNWLPGVTSIYTAMGGDPRKSVHTGGGDDYTGYVGTGVVPEGSDAGDAGGPYTGKVPTDRISKALRKREGEREPHSWCYVAHVNQWYDAVVNGVDTQAGTNTSTGTTGGPLLAEFMSIVRAQIGKPYIWGAGGPSSFDCSGLFNYGFSEIGKPRPGRWIVGPPGGNTTSDYTDQAQNDPENWEEGTDWSQIREGDFIIASSYGHILVYAGDDKYIHASGGQACPNKPGSRCRVVEDSNFKSGYSGSAAKWVRYKPFWDGVDPNNPAGADGDADTVYVQAGHVAPREPGYGAQPGAPGEMTFNKAIADKLIAKLRARNIDAKYVPGKVDPLAAPGAVFISIHHDEATNGRGFVGYAISGTKENFYAGDGVGTARDEPVPGAVPHRSATTVTTKTQRDSLALARRVDRQMRAAGAGPKTHWTGLGRPSHPNDRRAMRYYGFYRTNADARILVEVGRGGHPFLNKQEEISTALAKAVAGQMKARRG